MECCNEPRHTQKKWLEFGYPRTFVICRTCGQSERVRYEITSWEQSKIDELKQLVNYLLNRLKVYPSQNQKPPLPTQLMLDFTQVTHQEAA